MSLKTLWHNTMHPIEALDHWWFRVSPDRRLDRNAGNIAMLIGLMCPSLAIILTGPVPNSTLTAMPDWLQVWMCAFIFLGCGIKLHGALSGSRWWFPHKKLKDSYSMGFIGAPFAASGLWVYGWFILANTPNLFSALGGVLTPILGVGIGFQAVLYWLEWRRITRNEAIMIAEAKAHIQDDSDSMD